MSLVPRAFRCALRKADRLDIQTPLTKTAETMNLCWSSDWNRKQQLKQMSHCRTLDAEPVEHIEEGVTGTKKLFD